MNLNFRQFLENTISQHLKQNNLSTLRAVVEKVPQVVDFLKKVEKENRIEPLTIGKIGTLLLGFENTFRIPIKIVGEENTYVLLERTDGNDWSELYHLWPVFDDPKTKKILVLPKTRAIIIDESHEKQLIPLEIPPITDELQD